MYLRRRSTRSGFSRMLTHDHRRRAKDLVADGVSLLDDGENDAVLCWMLRGRRRDRFVPERIEGPAERWHAGDAEGFEFGQKLVAHELDAPRQAVHRPGRGRSSGLMRGGDGAIEIVDHIEELAEHSAPATLDFTRGFPPHADLDFLEFLERPVVLGRDGLEPRGQAGEPLFELFDVGRLPRSGLIRRCRIPAGPPAAIDDAKLWIFFPLGCHMVILPRFGTADLILRWCRPRLATLQGAWTLWSRARSLAARAPQLRRRRRVRFSSSRPAGFGERPCRGTSAGRRPRAAPRTTCRRAGR